MFSGPTTKQRSARAAATRPASAHWVLGPSYVGRAGRGLQKRVVRAPRGTDHCQDGLTLGIWKAQTVEP